MESVITTSAVHTAPKQRRRTKEEREMDELCAQPSMMPLAAFERLVREIVAERDSDLRVSREVVLQLRCASEAYLDDLMNLASRFAAHAGRQTMHVTDMQQAGLALK